MDDKARSTPAGTASAGTPDAAVILRVLRVCLHSGFAVLLLVALVRLLGTGLQGTGWLALGLALILAAVYLLGTILEKRHSTDPSRFDPRPYSHLWLGAVCLLWLLLIWASADFVWLAFPLFFLQLHVLPLRLALPSIALFSLMVVDAVWFHNSGADGGNLQLPMVL
jgi:heme exporter protein D